MLVGEAKKRLTLAMVIDVVEQTRKNLSENKIATEKDVRNAKKFLVNFSETMEATHQALKHFLMDNMYRHPTVNRMTEDAKKIISSLFDFYMKNPNNLPFEIGSKFLDEKILAGFVSDYIAGMTDRFAIKEFERLT